LDTEIVNIKTLYNTKAAFDARVSATDIEIANIKSDYTLLSKYNTDIPKIQSDVADHASKLTKARTDIDATVIETTKNKESITNI
jgi:hypothetical protein